MMHHVNYRYVIKTLLRKPGEFRSYRYRDDLFPSLVLRHAWDQLQLWYPPRKAGLIYLRVLQLADRTLESEVACTLDLLMAAATRWDGTDVQQMVQPPAVYVPELTLGTIEIEWDDQLLQEACHESA